MGRSAHKSRGNRYKKDIGARRRRLIRTFAIGLRFCGLLAALLVLSSVFVTAYAAATQCHAFRTQKIEINGLTRLSRCAVLEQAGLHEGDNLLSVNLHLVHRRLLAHPWIAAAQVTRNVPATISITLREQRPLAAAQLGTRRFLLNTEGRLFKEVEARDPGDLPLITGIGYADVSLEGEPLSPALQTLRQVLNLCRSQDSILPFDSLETIHLDAVAGISLTQRNGGRRFKLGLEGFEGKFDLLRKLVRHLEGNVQWQGFRLVDISNPERVVVQLDTARTPEGDV